MKHVFLVHSNITRICTLKIIGHLGLRDDDVFISCPSGFKEGFGNFSNLYHFRYDLSLKAKNKNYQEFDEYLSKVLDNKKFAVYLPHVYASDYQIIASHKNCREVSFLEEGMAAYFPVKALDGKLLGEKTGLNKAKASVKNLLYSMGKGRIFVPEHLYDVSLFRNKRTVFYGLTAKSFHFLKGNKVVLNFAEEKKNLAISDRNILVLDALPENKLIDENFYIEKIKEIINGINANFLQIKFHPRQSAKVKEEVLKFTHQKGLNYEILDIFFVLEDYFVESDENLTVHGFVSSLLFYAKNIGHKVKSYEDLLKKDSTYRQHLQKNTSNIQALLKD